VGAERAPARALWARHVRGGEVRVEVAAPHPGAGQAGLSEAGSSDEERLPHGRPFFDLTQIRRPHGRARGHLRFGKPFRLTGSLNRIWPGLSRLSRGLLVGRWPRPETERDAGTRLERVRRPGPHPALRAGVNEHGGSFGASSSCDLSPQADSASAVVSCASRHRSRRRNKHPLPKISILHTLLTSDVAHAAT
jgi:hypothetical protein